MPLRRPDDPTGEQSIERRLAAMAPLFHYMQRRCYAYTSVARRAYEQAGVPFNARMRIRVHRIKQGECLPPWWFVRNCCEVMGAQLTDVVDAAWLREFGVEFGGFRAQSDADAYADALEQPRRAS